MGVWMENGSAGDGGLQRSGFSVHIRCRLYRTLQPTTTGKVHDTETDGKGEPYTSGRAAARPGGRSEMAPRMDADRREVGE